MKGTGFHRLSLTVIMLCVALGAGVCSGQGRPGDRLTPRGPKRSGPSSADVLRVRRLEGLGRHGIVRTPEYKTGLPGSRKPRGEWAQISLTYDTSPDWIDELTFQYYAMSMIQEEGKRKYSFYKTTVRYGDIEKDREHQSTVFLNPRTLKRYGELVAIAVEIAHKGKVIESKSEINMKLPDDWWKNPIVVQSEDVTARDGYLLDRSKTPFAFVNTDDYEVIK